MRIKGSQLRLKTWHWLSMASLLVLAGYLLLQQWIITNASELAVAKTGVIRSVEVRGKVQSPVPIEIRSQINGKIVSAPLVEGQAVHTGQTLLIIENSDGRRPIEIARARSNEAAARLKKISMSTQAGSEQSLRLAQTAVDKRKLQYARTTELAQRGLIGTNQASEALRNLAIAQSQLSNVQFQVKANRAKGSDYALAETALNKARANESAVSKRYAKNIITAESGGLLIVQKVKTGSKVTAGQVLMSLTPTGKTQLIVQVEEKKFRMLKLGQQAKVHMEAMAGEPFNAEVSFITPGIDKIHGYAEVKLNVDFVPDYVRNDMHVLVDFLTD